MHFVFSLNLHFSFCLTFPHSFMNFRIWFHFLQIRLLFLVARFYGTETCFILHLCCFQVLLFWYDPLSILSQFQLSSLKRNWVDSLKKIYWSFKNISHVISENNFGYVARFEKPMKPQIILWQIKSLKHNINYYWH